MNLKTSFLILSFIVFSLVIYPSIISVNAETHQIMSPKKQMKSGIAAEDVECKSGLVLMIRSNGVAACVKPATSMNLSEAGWGEIVKTTTKEGNEKELIFEEELSMGEHDEMPENSNKTIIELEETLSAGEDDSMSDDSSKEIFSIGGIDLSMASPVEGDVDAPITIIEFGDYQCPKCKQWFEQAKSSIVSKHILTGNAKLYFVDIAWLGDNSIIAAQASYCADDQGKYREYHSKLYQNQGDIQDGWASPDSLKKFANELNLDQEIFDECLDSGKYSERIAYNTDVATSNGVEGTPHFFVIGPDGTKKTISGPQPSVVFDAAILSLGY